MNAHRGLSESQSQQLGAALVLLLANHVKDQDLLRGCLRAALATVRPQESA